MIFSIFADYVHLLLSGVQEVLRCRYPGTKGWGLALLCVVKHIVIARESEILAKFGCLGGTLLAANEVWSRRQTRDRPECYATPGAILKGSPHPACNIVLPLSTCVLFRGHPSG
jgi:hypothetical protein